MDKILKKLSEEKVTFEDLFFFMQKAAVIGTWEVNVESQEIYWSEVTRQIHEVKPNYKPNLEEGINFYKEGESRKSITYLYNRAIDNCEQFDTELQIVTSKGNEKWVRAIGYPVVKDGRCINVIGLFQDITEKTLQSQKIALKEEQFRASFDLSSIGMVLASLEGRFIKVNKAFAKIVGYEIEECKRLTREDVVQPNDLKNALAAVPSLLNETIEVYEDELRFITKNNTLIWCHISASLIKNDNGEPLHLLAHITDISKKKAANKRINNLLSTTKKQNKRLLNFAHIVSHNLRSHSGNLTLLLELIRDEHKEATENEYFPLLEVAANNLNETISNLNEVSLITTNVNKTYSTINVYNSIQETINCLRAKMLQSNAVIHNNIDRKDTLKVIPAYFESIVLNFISNAIKYRRDDVNPVIEINSEIQEKYYVIHFKDNGKGIDLKLHGKKIFGLYNTFHKHKEAKGLGLYLSKNQIEAMKGKVTVESKVNKGTTFSIFLKL